MSTGTETVVGVFNNQNDAQRAIADLKKHGFTENQIGVVYKDPDGVLITDSETRVEEGAIAGLATGAGLGALWGVGILSNVVPGIGPAIFGGTLGIIMSSAAAGATVAGIGGALAGLGLSEVDSTYYDNEFKAGRTIVTVHGTAVESKARSILNQHGGFDRLSAVR